MKKMIGKVGILFLLLAGTCQANAPHQIAGFVLGSSINDYKDLVRSETCMPIRNCEYLREIEIKHVEGYKSGLIWYGACNPLNRIVRIKMKYSDSSKSFFQEILDRYKKQFGKPTEWRGDPFHILIAWKWSFTDHDNNKISLILQHNTEDAERKFGNCVKLTMWNLFDEEHRCFEGKHKNRLKAENKLKDGYRDSLDWRKYIPQ